MPTYTLRITRSVKVLKTCVTDVEAVSAEAAINAAYGADDPEGPWVKVKIDIENHGIEIEAA